MPFQVIPVIDVFNGHAVHAVAGRRAHYQPLQSILHASCEPIPLARALRDALDLETLYIADLDAIEGGTPAIDVYREIMASGLHVWIDAGIRDVRSLAPLLGFDQSSYTIIAGLETVQGPRSLAEIVKQAGSAQVIFSLDLFAGRPKMAAPAAWGTEDSLELAEAAIACGVRHLLILDLACVGTSRGTGTSSLMNQIRRCYPSIGVTVGGGISRIEEVVELRAAGADAVLVGSAIHDGRIGARELDQLETGSP